MITASIVTYNTAQKDILRLLYSILGTPIDNIYIIDNSPTNFLLSKIDISHKILYYHGHGNIGYGSGHNIALNDAIEKGAKYHIILNPDVYFEESIIENIYNYIKNDDSIGLLMPKILYPSGKTQYLCKLLPTPFDLLFRRFCPFPYYVKKMNDKYELKFTDYNKMMEVPSLSGCFMYINLQVIRNIGGFDERFFMYAEDMDLCRRIGEVSKTIYYPHVEVFHEYAKESYSNIKLLMYHIISLIKYFNKWGWFFDKKRTNINNSFLLKYKKNE